MQLACIAMDLEGAGEPVSDDAGGERKRHVGATTSTPEPRLGRRESAPHSDAVGYLRDVLEPIAISTTISPRVRGRGKSQPHARRLAVSRRRIRGAACFVRRRATRRLGARRGVQRALHGDFREGLGGLTPRTTPALLGAEEYLLDLGEEFPFRLGLLRRGVQCEGRPTYYLALYDRTRPARLLTAAERERAEKEAALERALRERGFTRSPGEGPGPRPCPPSGGGLASPAGP